MVDSAFGQGVSKRFSNDIRHLPFPANVTEIELDPTFEDIELVCRQSVTDLAQFYQSEMKARGWNADEGGSRKNTRMVRLMFSRGDAEVDIELERRNDGQTDVSLDTDELHWQAANDPDALLSAGVPQPQSLVFLQRQVPKTPDATSLEFEDDECEFLSDLEFPAVVSFYTSTLSRNGWSEDVGDRFNGKFLHTRSYRKGSVTLEVKANKNHQGSGSRVTLAYENSDADQVIQLDVDRIDATRASTTLSVANTEVLKIQSISSDSMESLLDNAGQAKVIRGDQVTLPHVAAYRTGSMDERSVVLLFSSEPIVHDHLQQAIRTGEPIRYGQLFASDPPEHLEIELTPGKMRYRFHANGVSTSATTDAIVSKLDFSQRRVRGTVGVQGVIIDQGAPLLLTAEIDAVVVTPDSAIKGESIAFDYEVTEVIEVPLPADMTVDHPYQYYGYIVDLTGTVPYDFDSVVGWCKELARQEGWIDRDPMAARVGDTIMLRYLDVASGPIDYVVTQSADATHLRARARRIEEAGADDVLPPPGMTRLLLVNLRDANVEITLQNNAQYMLDPKQGAKNFLNGESTVVPPGQLAVRVVDSNGNLAEGQIDCAGNQSLLVIVNPDGFRLGEVY